MQFSSLSARIVPHIAGGGLMGRHALPRRFWLDGLAFILVATFFIFISWGMTEMSGPIARLHQEPISLDFWHLIEYAFRTSLRMLLAMCCSLLFTLIYAPLAAKSRKAEQLMVPLIDILRSVPVLGFISFTVTGFMALFPGSMMGMECAAVFAIFSSQAWNMTFSLYQSMRTIPNDMDEAAFVYKLSGWQKFWKVELPFAMPGLIWNMMISMSGGWFFVVASEAITVGNLNIMLPGIGSYIAVAITHRDLTAIGMAILVMGVVILLYDQFLFRPLVAWSDKFRYEQTTGEAVPTSWVRQLFLKSRLARKLLIPLSWISGFVLRIRLFAPQAKSFQFTERESRLFDYLWYSLLGLAVITSLRYMHGFFHNSLTWDDVFHVTSLALITMIRIIVLITMASLLWVPVGVFIGLRPKLTQIVQPLAQILSAFPANLLYPVAVVLISHYKADPDIWLSPLMVLGTQWYILFNVVAGASSFPNDLRDTARNLRVGGWLWWRKLMLPYVFPYYLTGVIAASGGAWNASVVAEVVSWGNQSYTATGLGSYIAQMTQEGDYVHIAFGIGVMALIVVLFNRCVWYTLYEYSSRKLRLD